MNPAHWPVEVHPLYGCYEWQGRRTTHGYGLHQDMPAHVAVYEAEIGPLPPGRPELDHLCCNRSCVRPEHLEPVTRSENLRRKKPAYRRGVRCAKHDQHTYGQRVPHRGDSKSAGWVCLACAPRP